MTAHPEILDLPVLPLRDVVVFPHMVIPLFVGRDKSIRALDLAMEADKQILLVAQKSAETDDPVAGDPERQDLTESMLPADVADQLLAARRRQLGIDAIETTSLAPATVADLEAFRAEYEYRTIDGVRFLGVCYGAMRPAGVYLLQYEAPAIHYFERDLAAFESIVQSMRRLSKEERKARNP